MQRLLSIAVLMLVPCVALAANESAKLKQLQSSVAASQTKTKQLEGTITQTSKELEGLQDKVGNIAKEVQDSERRLTQRERELVKVNADLRAAENDYEMRRGEYGRTVRSLLKMRELPATAYLAEPKNMQQMLRTGAVMELTSKALSEKASELSNKIKDLNNIRQKAEQANKAVKSDQTRLKQEQAKLAIEVGKRQSAIKGLRGDYAKEQARLAELSKQAKTVQELIEKLDTKPKPGVPFRSAKPGTAKAPVTGGVVHKFGEKKNDNETYRGMVFKARPSGTVVAPNDGEVVFTGPFRDYGRMVLLRHANGYISLLAGLGRVDVGLNQNVRSGEPLGAMPGTGSGELYVELREKSKPIDPTRWFAKLPGSLARN